MIFMRVGMTDSIKKKCRGLFEKLAVVGLLTKTTVTWRHRVG
jgi:hypothetical protein